jgi:colanic acid/amylovoran biosynthesis protein
MANSRPPSRALRIGIVGVTISGNLGGQAMLLSTLQNVKRCHPDAQFRLFSIYPVIDRTTALGRQVEIASVRPGRLVLFDLPIALVYLLLAKLLPGSVVRSLSFGHLRRIAECDLVVDLSGIAFVEGRGLPLLAYNLACCVPSFSMGVKHAKLAQSLGPFRSKPWRVISSWALSKCCLVVGRGQTSVEHLSNIGVGALALADTSFALELSVEDESRAQRILPAAAADKPLVIISPSRVTRRACEAKGIDYIGALASVAQWLTEQGRFVAIVPHSFSAGAGKNNDVAEVDALMCRLQSNTAVAAVEAPQDAAVLRAFFGFAEMAVTSRFHATVAALASGVPPLTISWSYKYKELLQQFDCEELVIDADSLSAPKMIQELSKIVARRETLAATLQSKIEFVRASAVTNFQLLEAHFPAYAPIEALGVNHARDVQ